MTLPELLTQQREEFIKHDFSEPLIEYLLLVVELAYTQGSKHELEEQVKQMKGSI